MADLARELVALGHRPVVLASSDDPADLRRMRILMRRSDDLAFSLLSSWKAGSPAPDELLPRFASGPLDPRDGVPVLPLGHSFPMLLNGSVANIGLPVDLLSRLERLLIGGQFDVVHVHEPIAPSLGFTAIREARAPVISSFHLTPAALLAYELGQPILEPFYRRLDVRICATDQSAVELNRLFGGEYQVLLPGARLGGGPSSAFRQPAEEPGDGLRLLYVYRGDDRRGLRALLRALASLEHPPTVTLTVAVHLASAERWPPRPAPRRLRSRTRWVEFERDQDLADLYAAADAVILPYLGGEWLLQTAMEAILTGNAVLSPSLPLSTAVVKEPGTGLLFSPALEASLQRALLSLADDEQLSAYRARSAELAASVDLRAVAGQVVELYRAAPGIADQKNVARERRPKKLRSSVRLRHSPGWLYADLHVHSNHSKDSVSSVDAILATAREVGLGALAIADHNSIEGGLEARELAGDDLVIIVAEEVKTQQGEVIGLFLERTIPGGLTFDETLGLIKEQGGLVYVPHPFDRLRTTPSYRSMVDNLHRIDAIETYNARVALSSFNLNAERFAAKYNVPAGAGSDAHVLQGLGTAMLRMRRFNGPEEFLSSLREADIVTRRKSLLYIQSLKLLQTTLDHVLPGS